MQTLCSSVSLTLTFFLGLWLSPGQKSSLGVESRPVSVKAEDHQLSDAFSGVLRNRRARITRSQVVVSLKAAELRPRMLTVARGLTPVLSVPIEVTNSTPHPISMSLTHEWYGGIWPTTDLYVATRVNGANGPVWEVAPGFQAGESDSADPTTLTAGEAKAIEVRLNWPGTGSVPTAPLIDASAAGKHRIKFLLFYRSGGVEECVESGEFIVEVRR